MVMRRPVLRPDPFRYGISKTPSSGSATPDPSISNRNEDDHRTSMGSAGSSGSGNYNRIPPMMRAMSASQVALEKMIYGGAKREVGMQHNARSSQGNFNVSRPVSGRKVSDDPHVSNNFSKEEVSSVDHTREPNVPGLRGSREEFHVPKRREPTSFLDTSKARAETAAGKGWSTSIVKNLEAAEKMLKDADERRHPHHGKPDHSDEEHTDAGHHALGWATAAAAERREKRLQARIEHDHSSPLKAHSPTKRTTHHHHDAKGRNHDLSDYFGIKPSSADPPTENEHPYNASPTKKARSSSKFFGDAQPSGAGASTVNAPGPGNNLKPPRAPADNSGKIKRAGIRSSLEKDMEYLSKQLNSEGFRQSMSRMVSRPRSPRSERLFRHFPDQVRAENDAKDEKKIALAKLQKTKADIRKTLSMSTQVMEMTSALLVDFFRDVPDEELTEHIATCFAHFDTNKNGVLEEREVQLALRQLGKPCSDDDVRDFFRIHLPPGAKMDLHNFEEIIRACHGWERAPAADDCFPDGDGFTTDRTSVSSRMW